MSLLGHERRFRYLRGTSAYPPRLAVKADIPDRQVRAMSGRKQDCSKDGDYTQSFNHLVGSRK